jgi:hypothetical protein
MSAKAKIESLITLSTDPSSLITTVKSTASILGFDIQEKRHRPVAAENIATGPAFFQLQIMDPRRSVPVVCSERVQYSGRYVILELATSKGGEHPIRTVCTKQNSPESITVVQVLQISTSVGRPLNMKYIASY